MEKLERLLDAGWGNNMAFDHSASTTYLDKKILDWD